MPVYETSRVLAFLTGNALLLFGAAGIWATQHQFEGPAATILCRAGLCASEFNLTRIFVLQQEAQIPGGAEKVLPLLRRALSQDSASAYRWADLGNVELEVHDEARARFCFDKALQAGPHSPVMLFRAANFDWQSGNPAGALAKLRRVLEDPQLSNLYDNAFLTYSRLDVPIQTVLDSGVPHRLLPASRFLAFEIAHRDAADAGAIWTWMQHYNLSNDETAGAYCNFLIQDRRPEQAAEAWKHYADPEGPYRRETWVFNGGFESPSRPSPFDWHIGSTPGVTADRTDKQAASGTHSLQLQFLGRDNAAYEGTYQDVAVPAGSWLLKAHAKTDDLVTTAGLQLHVFDLSTDHSEPGKVDALSETVSGSTDWTTLTARFHIGAGTRLLRVEIERQSSPFLDEHVRGTAWIDDVQLTPDAH